MIIGSTDGNSQGTRRSAGNDDGEMMKITSNALFHIMNGYKNYNQ